MRFSRDKIWIICIVVGFALVIIAPLDAASTPPEKRTISAATKDAEMHRLLTESPPDWVQLLLSQGANIEARNLHQETPLITSAGQGNFPLVELLLQNHADMQAADEGGNTALHVAGFNSRIKVVELLLKNGAKAHVLNSLGFSPLHQAVRRFWEVPGETEAGRAENQRQIVLLLLKHGADPDLKDLSHRTAAVLATESNNPALAPLFDARSMSSGEQATAPSPGAPRLPLQQSPIDTPPQNEPEARQIEDIPAPENSREADSAKTDTAVAESQPIPSPSGSETGLAHPLDTKPLEPLQPSEPSEPSVIASSPSSPPEEQGAVGPAISDREEPRPSPPTMPHEPATPPDANPPASFILPGRRSEAGIPHTKAMPDLPKQKSDHAPQAPHTMNQPSPEPNQVEARPGNRDHAQLPAKDSSDNWIFRNLGFGLGIGWTHNLGPQRIESATAVNGVVRVDADRNDLVRFMPEVHLWMDQWDDQRWSWGPFLSLVPGSNLIDAVGFGLLLGYRSHQTDRYTFNLGVGGTLDFNQRVLGDGLTANQPLPAGENQVRTKQTTAPGLLIMLSVGWDIGMPRRSSPPGQTP